jgi:hypothetical protein
LPPERLEVLGYCLVEAIEKREWPSVFALLKARKEIIQELVENQTEIPTECHERISASHRKARALLEQRRKAVCVNLGKLSQRKKAVQAYRSAA